MPKIVGMSCWSTGGEGEYPVRYVVLDWGPDKTQRYSRHLQVNDGKTENYFIHGDYKGTLIDALASAQKSVKGNNESFRKGNISHIPAWPNGELVRIVKASS